MNNNHLDNWLQTALIKADILGYFRSQEISYRKIDNEINHMSEQDKSIVYKSIVELLDSRNRKKEMQALRLIYLLGDKRLLTALKLFKGELYRGIRSVDPIPSVQFIDNLITSIENPSSSDRLEVTPFDYYKNLKETYISPKTISRNYDSQSENLLISMFGKAGKMPDFAKDGNGMILFIAREVRKLPYDQQMVIHDDLIKWLLSENDHDVGNAVFLVSELDEMKFLPALQELRNDMYRGKKRFMSYPALSIIDNMIKRIKEKSDGVHAI